MRVLKENDYKTFEQLCGLTQTMVKRTMSYYLKPKYKKFVETDKYIYAEGDIPIALVAHMDTVFKGGADEVFYDRNKNVIWSPTGLGADDRAGIYAIIQIVKSGLRPHIILTTDEEKGALGASTLTRDVPQCPFSELRYLIQLDRRGADDCVFYDCYNKDFIDYVESFGFVENWGSFSDISVIAPAWGIAAVNLSIGYRDEHSVSEVLFVGQMLNTIQKVMTMLQATDIPSFNYVPSPFSYPLATRWYKTLSQEGGQLTCKCCKKTFDVSELIDVKEKKTSRMVPYCIDCLGDKISWCRSCGEAYEKGGDGDIKDLCEDCYYDFYYNY